MAKPNQADGPHGDLLSPPLDEYNEKGDASHDEASDNENESHDNKPDVEDLDPAVWCLLDRVGRRHWLNCKGLLLIGREDCSLMLKSHSVDPQHAVMTYDADLRLYRVKDLGTVNGTFVNESRIAEDTYVYLDNGDSLRFGYDSNVFRVQRFSPTTATAAAAAAAAVPTAVKSSTPVSAAASRKSADQQPVVSRPSLSGLPAWASGASRGVSAMAECPACTQGSEEFRRSSADLTRLCLFHQKELERAAAPKSHDASVVSSPHAALAPVASSASMKILAASVTDSLSAGLPDPGFSKDSLNVAASRDQAGSNKPFTRVLERKKIKELYGQPAWWGTDDADDDEAAEAENRKQKKQQQQQQQPPPPPASPPSRRPPNRHAEAFTVALTDEPSTEALNSDAAAGSSSLECVASEGGGGGGSGSADCLQVTDSLSHFVPSKIRKSFQERQEMKRKKVEELRERTRQQQQQQQATSSSLVAKRPSTASRQASVPHPAAPSKQTPARTARSVSGSATGSGGGKALLFDRLLNNAHTATNSSVSSNTSRSGAIATGDRRRASGAANQPGSRTSIRDKPLPPPPPRLSSSSQKQPKPQQQQKQQLKSSQQHQQQSSKQQRQNPPTERDLYSEASRYEHDKSDPDDVAGDADDDAISETGTYTISESDSAHEDAEFRHLEALADSLDAGQELELKSGPKWVAEMVGSAAAATAPSTKPNLTDSTTLTIDADRDDTIEDNQDDLGSGGTHRSKISDVLSDSGAQNVEQQQQRQKLLEEQQRAASLDTAFLLQDTAAVLHHMEARLARGECGSSYAEDEEVDAQSSLRSRLSALRVAGKTQKQQQQQQQQKKAFEYGRHSLKMPASNSHPPPVCRNAAAASASFAAGAVPPPPSTSQPPHQRSSVWRSGRRPESLHEETSSSAAKAARNYSGGSAEDVARLSRDGRAEHHRGRGGTDLSRDLERLARREDLGGFGPGGGSRQSSAFSPTARSRSPSSGGRSGGGGGDGGVGFDDSPSGVCGCCCHGNQQQHREEAAYDTVLVSSLVRMSCKLRRCSDGLLGRLRRSRHLSRTPSPAEDVLLNIPEASGHAGAAAPERERSDFQENLHSCLYNLQAVQYHIQIIERAIFPQAQSGRNSALGSCSEGDYLMERERINSEVRGFQPIEPAFPSTQLKFYTDYK